MWESKNKGEPIGYIDGKPIYADGSRGTPETKKPSMLVSADNQYSEREADRQLPQLTRLDESGGRRLRRALRLVFPVVMLLGFLGVFATAQLGERFEEIVDDASGLVDEARKELEAGTDPLAPALTGAFTAEIVVVQAESGTVIARNGRGQFVLHLAPEVQPERALRFSGRVAKLTWKRENHQTLVTGIAPAGRVGLGTPPPPV